MEEDVNIKFNLALEALDDAKFNFENERFKVTINRCYYAVFYIAHALLIKKGFFPKSHKGTIIKFGEEYVLNGDFDEKIAKIFSQLEERREKSDYNSFFNYDEELVVSSIEKAESFIEEAKKFL
jgi:uncharacterized protein (UPF0332 family)